MVSVIIPVYNGAPFIGNTLKKIDKRKYDIIVVDDGSTDDTSKVVKSLGYSVVRIKKNSGKANACMTGLRKSKHDICVFIDGDDQHDPREIKKLLKKMKNFDMVIGERCYKDIPSQRKISNSYARILVNYITGYRFRDVLCGFRAVRRSKFNELQLKRGGYFFECEMILEAKRKDLKITTADVNVNYDTGSRMGITKSMAVAAWLFKEMIKKSIRG
ncbi:glycosyltransferase family 2 protein [Candidatus Aenigmatarchaeota archaeon]